MKIAYMVSWYPTLNDTFVVREIGEIARAGHEVRVCVLKPGRPAANAHPVAIDGVAITQMSLRPVGLVAGVLLAFGGAPTAFLRCLWEATRAATRQPARGGHYFYVFAAAAWFSRHDVVIGTAYVHAHFLHVGALAARWLARMLGMPYGLTAHTSRVRLAWQLMADVVGGADVCAADTIEAADLLARMNGKSPTLIRNGLDLSEATYRERAVTKIATAARRSTILAVGTLIEPKGFHVLIEACRMLQRSHTAFVCRIIGDGVERPFLESLGRELLDAGRLEMPGTLPIRELMIEYARASVFVMPSVASAVGTDGLPTVIIEAMAHGIPVIASRHAAIPELVRDGVTGTLVPPADPAALAQALRAALEGDGGTSEMCRRARRVVEEEFDLKRNAASLLGLVSAAVQTPRGRRRRR